MATDSSGSVTPAFDPRQRSTAEVFAELSIELHDAPGVEETAETVVDFARHAIGCDHAGLALARHDGRADIGAVTNQVVADIYQFQIDIGEGPMLDALAGRSPSAVVHISDATTETLWPAWAAKVTATGIRSVLHMPMQSGGRTIGVLSLYSAKPHGFGTDDQAIAHLLAQHAAVAVSNAQHDESMAAAVDARRTVGQAMGILMERFAVDEDRAFAILRRYSQDTNTKLRDVAQHLIDTRQLPPNQADT